MYRVSIWIRRLVKANDASSVKLCSAFWPWLKNLTPFKLLSGLFQFKVIHCRVCGAPALIQRMMDVVLLSDSVICNNSCNMFSPLWDCIHFHKDLLRHWIKAGLIKECRGQHSTLLYTFLHSFNCFVPSNHNKQTININVLVHGHQLLCLCI